MQLRLPADVHASLVAEAEANDRSLNGEIVNRLRSTFKGGARRPDRQKCRPMSSKAL